MEAGNLVFLTEDNSARMKDAVPPELWAAKMQELELKRAAAIAPPFIPIKDAWICLEVTKTGDLCECMNAGQNQWCSECDEPKPEDENLKAAMRLATVRQEENHKREINAIREQLKTKDEADAKAKAEAAQ